MTQDQCDARPTGTFPAVGHHRPLAGTKLYCFVTEAHRCEQFAWSFNLAADQLEFELTTCQSQIQCPNHRASKNSKTAYQKLLHNLFSIQCRQTNKPTVRYRLKRNFIPQAQVVIITV